MSKVILWATLVLVMCLAMVLGLVLVLLSQLYFSLLLRRRRLLQMSTTSNTTTTTSTWTAHAARNDCLSQPPQLHDQPSPALQPLTSFYAQGVLRAPGTFLFPTVQSKEDHKLVVDIEKQNSQLRHFFLVAETREPKPISLPFPVASPVGTPKPIEKVTIRGGSDSGANGGACGGGGGGSGVHDLVYISNPIYVNDAACCGPSSVETPFETPDTSPSRLEPGGSSSSSTTTPSSPFTSLPVTPPLTPMAKLPAEACSVSLRDAGSLPTSGCDSDANRCLSSSSSAASPHTSSSWWVFEEKKRRPALWDCRAACEG